MGLPPTEFSTTHSQKTAENTPTIEITSPETKTIEPGTSIRVEVEIDAPYEIKKVEFFINNERKFFSTNPPYTGTLLISRFTDPGSVLEITAKIIDKLGYSSTASINILVEENNNQEEEEDEESKNDTEEESTEENEDNTTETEE